MLSDRSGLTIRPKAPGNLITMHARRDILYGLGASLGAVALSSLLADEEPLADPDHPWRLWHERNR
ncbi:MAG: hypothetical protein ACO3FE_04500, partial [Planctomycetaceae bacterium]